MPKIDDVEREKILQIRREENQILIDQGQERKWKRRQLKYWWVTNIIAFTALIFSIVQFFYTSSKESEQQKELDKINLELIQIDKKYKIRLENNESVYQSRKDSLQRLKNDIEIKN